MTDDRKIVRTGKHSLTIQHGTGAANVIDQVLSDAIALARSSEVSKEVFTEINGIMFDQLSVKQLKIWAKTIIIDENEDSLAEIDLSQLVELMNSAFFESTSGYRFIQIEHWVCDGKIVAACFPEETYWRKGELGLSQLTALIFIGADSNQLTQLDVSNNPELTKLFVSDNQLTQLDVSNNPELTELYVDSNQLAALRFSNEIDLENLLGINIPSYLKFDKVKGYYTNE